MTAHELAKELLKMPPDTIVIYSEGKTTFTKVEKVEEAKTNGYKMLDLSKEIKDKIAKIIPSTYAILN